MDDPAAWTEAISPNSAHEAIATIQKRLVEWHWLEKGAYSKGKLDEATVQAILDFQNYCNESGMNVALIDSSDPVVDTDSLRLLFNADGASFKNPNA